MPGIKSYSVTEYAVLQKDGVFKGEPTLAFACERKPVEAEDLESALKKAAGKRSFPIVPHPYCDSDEGYCILDTLTKRPIVLYLKVRK